MASLVVLPSLIMTLSSGTKDQKILVIDNSGICEPFFKNGEEYTYIFDSHVNADELKKNFPQELYALVEISSQDSLYNLKVTAHSPKQLNIDLKQQIEHYVQKALEDSKIKRYNIENLDIILKEIKSEVTLKTFTLSKTGDEKLGMVEIYMGVSYLLSFLIYIFIFMFGSMVMRGVIEEKTNRIVEVIISSIKPFQLMLGKILGVGSVALLQFLIWIILTIGIIFGVQNLVDIEKISQGTNIAQQLTGGAAEMEELLTVAQNNTPLNDVMSSLSSLPVTSIIISFMFYFLLGYLLYAAMFSAVGSAVDNEADTQQLVLPITLPLIIGLFLMIHTFQYPDSSLSFWGSMIPFTSPMVMMARVPFGVPLWELALSLLILVITFIFMTWVSAKIYRVGILMYGKKASWKEISKWIRY